LKTLYRCKNEIVNNQEIQKLFNLEYFNLIRDNINDLIEIIKALVIINLNNGKVSINHMAKILIENKKVITYKFNGLNRLIARILDFLNKTFPNFELERKKLFSDDNLIGLNRNIIFQMYPNINKSEMSQIKVFLKKKKIIKEVFESKCAECGISIVYLPTFQFHHFTDKKTISWDSIKHLPYKDILQLLLKDNVEALCADCHEKKQSTIYTNFKSFIYNKELLNNSFSEIKKEVILFLDKKNLNQNLKPRILAWIYKRYIIEYFYNSECISCSKSCDVNSLQSFIFHHRTEIKTIEWSVIKKKNINEIIDWIKKDDCVCLCANCHSMLHSIFYLKYVDIIFNDEDLKFTLTKEIQKMKINIKNFKFEN